MHDFAAMCFCCIISIGVGEFVSRMGLGLVLKRWLAWAGAMDMGEMEGGREGVSDAVMSYYERNISALQVWR